MIPNMIPVIEEQLREKDKEIKRLEVENRELSEGYNEEFKENVRLNNIINELEKVLDENVELTYVYYGRRQYNKTLTEGGLLFRDYIKDKLQKLKGEIK